MTYQELSDKLKEGNYTNEHSVDIFVGCENSMLFSCVGEYTMKSFLEKFFPSLSL